MAENYLIAGIAISISINIIVILLLVLTGIGKDAWQRFIRKKLHRKGGYAYSLIATKDGNIAEAFSQVQHDGTFHYRKQPYVRESRMTKNFRGIPCHFHLEGDPSPKDPWEVANNDDNISTKELDNIMVSEDNFNFFKWLEENKGIIMIVSGLIVVLVAAAAYFGYMNGESIEAIRQYCSAKASEVVTPK